MLVSTEGRGLLACDPNVGEPSPTTKSQKKLTGPKSKHGGKLNLQGLLIWIPCGIWMCYKDKGRLFFYLLRDFQWIILASQPLHHWQAFVESVDALHTTCRVVKHFVHKQVQLSVIYIRLSHLYVYKVIFLGACISIIDDLGNSFVFKQIPKHCPIDPPNHHCQIIATKNTAFAKRWGKGQKSEPFQIFWEIGMVFWKYSKHIWQSTDPLGSTRWHWGGGCFVLWGASTTSRTQQRWMPKKPWFFFI